MGTNAVSLPKQYSYLNKAAQILINMQIFHFLWLQYCIWVWFFILTLHYNWWSKSAILLLDGLTEKKDECKLFFITTVSWNLSNGDVWHKDVPISQNNLRSKINYTAWNKIRSHYFWFWDYFIKRLHNGHRNSTDKALCYFSCSGITVFCSLLFCLEVHNTFRHQ